MLPCSRVMFAESLQGTGEAIRGNVNSAVDTASGDRQSAAKNEAIASQGINEMEHGHQHVRGTGAGVTPVDRDLSTRK